MKYDVVVVGGGVAGLTSAAYLSKAGYGVLLCEKNSKSGGLVNSFEYKGLTFDGGIRAIENSGIVFPMLKQLGIDIDFVSNPVTIGIEDKKVELVSKDSLYDYGRLLSEKFPGSQKDIDRIIEEISKVMGYMDVLYGIDNPLFRDLKNDREYLFKTVLPWLVRYKLNINKALRINEPIESYLKKFTSNEALISIIAQHFFKDTPAFFALSYFSLYLDYSYPKGGTGTIPEKLEEFVRSRGGHISLDTEIAEVEIDEKAVIDKDGQKIQYDKLIWATDLKQLYSKIDIDSVEDLKTKRLVESRKKFMEDKVGGDSVMTVYIAADIDKSYFEKICGAHMFYTPSKEGLHNAGELSCLEYGGEEWRSCDKDEIYSWLKTYYDLTTYEISCPAARDSDLAPEGQTGLIVSTLMDYRLVEYIWKLGLYEEFKRFSEKHISELLTEKLFPEMNSKIKDIFSSTPMTIQRTTGNSEGAITGWAFTNSEMPAEDSFKKISSSVLTGIPDVFQAGQWSFSPSGLPISILTGKMAADRAVKEL